MRGAIAGELRPESAKSRFDEVRLDHGFLIGESQERAEHEDRAGDGGAAQQHHEQQAHHAGAADVVYVTEERKVGKRWCV